MSVSLSTPDMLDNRKDDSSRWVELLRDGDSTRFARIEQDLITKRIVWFEENREAVESIEGDMLQRAYQLLLLKIGIDSEEAPIVRKRLDRIVIHSMNYCPSLQACIKLGLDTRIICKEILEKPTDVLMKQLHPHLKFSRNYRRLRPYFPYCEEIISLIHP